MRRSDQAISTSTSSQGILYRLKKVELWKNKVYYLMALPGLLLFFLFAYLPMPGIIIAFKNYNYRDGIFGSPWAGLRNFKFFFTSIYAWRTTFNTFWINFNAIFWGTIVAVTFAIMLNEIRNKAAKRFYQSFMFLPYFFSAIIIGRFTMLILGFEKGILNQAIKFFGGEAVKWNAHPEYWVFILVFVFIWKGAGYSVIIYLAAIMGIDEELFEAAQLDGATKLQQIRFITIPMLIPTIIILTLLAIGRIFFGDFQLIYAVVGDNGKLFPTTDIIETFLFRAIRTSAEFSMAGAVGLYQSVVGFILIFGSNTIIKKYNRDYSLF